VQDEKPHNRRDDTGAPERSAKRPYSTPKLVEYGHVAKLTQSGGNTVTESTIPKMQV